MDSRQQTRVAAIVRMSVFLSVMTGLLGTLLLDSGVF
jgi:hypothetical protein